MFDRSRKVGVNDTARPLYPDAQDSGLATPRPAENDASGESEAIKRYRRFFQTHDLAGLPHEDARMIR